LTLSGKSTPPPTANPKRPNEPVEVDEPLTFAFAFGNSVVPSPNTLNT